MLNSLVRIAQLSFFLAFGLLVASPLTGQSPAGTGRLDHCNAAFYTANNTSQPYREVDIWQFSSAPPDRLRDISVVDTMHTNQSLALCSRMTVYDQANAVYIEDPTGQVTYQQSNDLKSMEFYDPCLDALDNASALPKKSFDTSINNIDVHYTLGTENESFTHQVVSLAPYLLRPYFANGLPQPTHNQVLLTGNLPGPFHYSFPLASIAEDEVSLDNVSFLDQASFDKLSQYYQFHMPADWSLHGDPRFAVDTGTLTFENASGDTLFLTLSINDQELSGEITVEPAAPSTVPPIDTQFGADFTSMPMSSIDEYIDKQTQSGWAEADLDRLELTDNRGVVFLEKEKMYDVIEYSVDASSLLVRSNEGAICPSNALSWTQHP